MKVRCALKEGINGTGYENMDFNECREVSDKVSETLIKFGYVEPVEVASATPEEDEEKGETQGQSEDVMQGQLDEVSKEPEPKPVDKKSGDK